VTASSPRGQDTAVGPPGDPGADAGDRAGRHGGNGRVPGPAPRTGPVRVKLPALLRHAAAPMPKTSGSRCRLGHATAP